MSDLDAELADLEERPAPLAVRVQPPVAWVPSFVLPIEEMVKASDQMTEFQRRVMKEGVHYGAIPGTDKPTLLKPGAELLLSRMALRASDPIVLSEVIDYGECDVNGNITREGLIRFTVRRDIYRYTGATENDRMLIASGLGSCTSREQKYRWRSTQRLCPQCGKAAIIKGKEEYGGGWLCYKKKDGCGAKFKERDTSITEQVVGRVFNPEIADVENTILKMASKRALVDATLLATGASNAFTQDIGDDIDADDVPQPEPKKEPAKPKAAPAENPKQREAVSRAVLLGVIPGNLTPAQAASALRAWALARNAPSVTAALEVHEADLKAEMESELAAPRYEDDEDENDAPLTPVAQVDATMQMHAEAQKAAKKPTDMQRIKAMAAHNRLGHDDDMRHDYYEQTYGVRSFGDLTRDQASELIDFLERQRA